MLSASSADIDDVADGRDWKHLDPFPVAGHTGVIAKKTNSLLGAKLYISNLGASNAWKVSLEQGPSSDITKASTLQVITRIRRAGDGAGRHAGPQRKIRGVGAQPP